MVKKGSMVNFDKISAVVKSETKQAGAVTIGRPRLNPYEAEKKITVTIPENVHKQLRIASAYTGKPMVEIVVDALIGHLKEYEDK